MFHNPLQLLPDCQMCLSPCTGGELGSFTWVLVLVSSSASSVGLVGQAGRDVPDFLLGELSAGLFLCVDGSLQPRVQGRTGSLREQQPAELMAKIVPKLQLSIGSQSVLQLALAGGVGPRSGCFYYISTAPPPPKTSRQKKLFAFQEFVFCFLLVQLLEPTPQGIS